MMMAMLMLVMTMLVAIRTFLQHRGVRRHHHHKHHHQQDHHTKYTTCSQMPKAAAEP